MRKRIVVMAEDTRSAPVDTGPSTEGPDQCFHCGLPCRPGDPVADDHIFCCRGCLAVYHLLKDNRLSQYYVQSDRPGTRPASADSGRFAYLDSPDSQEALLDFADDTRARVTLRIPAIHCVSCVWLLENLSRLDTAVYRSTANLARQQLTIMYDSSQRTLRQIVELLSSLGYEPDIRLDSINSRDTTPPQRRLYMQIGVAGFCFANVMLFSIPEYLAKDGIGDDTISLTLRLASVVLSLPVLFYSSRDYFRSAWLSLRQRRLNLDVPLALGILTLFGRSMFDIATGTGIGYLDSFTGLVFFLLLGRLFQQKTFERLSFENDYRSYFPISCLKRDGSSCLSTPLMAVRVGDVLVIRNGELIPADSILRAGTARIDYSYVTGESAPVVVEPGSYVYAGGRQLGSAIDIEIIRTPTQSKLATLWESPLMTEPDTREYYSIADTVGKHFTVAVLTIAALTAVGWMIIDSAVVLGAFTAVLIVACPCALALSRPFVLGTAVRILGKHRLYLRSIDVLDDMAEIEEIVFDKTGTLTHPRRERLVFEGTPLNHQEEAMIATLARNSVHPVSRHLAALGRQNIHVGMEHFNEVPGRGIGGIADGREVRLGRYDWASFGDLNATATPAPDADWSVFVGIDGQLRGRYLLESQLRDRIDRAITELKSEYRLSVLTGDSSRDAQQIMELFGADTEAAYNQSPQDKLAAIGARTGAGRRVLMTGDGLNDAGALRAATVGLAVSEDTSAFSPACDGIIDAAALIELPRFLRVARRSRTLIRVSFALSFAYNVVGLSFAVSGLLSPLVAALLMPASSISVVVFASLATRRMARHEGMALS